MLIGMRKQIHFVSYVNLNKKMFICHLALPTRWQKEEFIMAKNKKKVSTPSETALCELEKEFLHREKMYESALTFLNNSDTIKGFISQETFEKTFKKVPGIKEEQQKFVEEVRIRLEKIFVDCLETAESDEEHFSLIEDLVSLSNEIENNTMMKIDLDGWKTLYNDKIYPYIISVESFLSLFTPDIKSQKGTTSSLKPTLKYNHKILKNFIIGGIGQIIISFYTWSLQVLRNPTTNNQ